MSPLRLFKYHSKTKVNPMKKLISIILSLALTLSLAACGGDAPATESTTAEKPTTESTSQTPADSKDSMTESSDDSVLPMSIGEAYTCNISGYEGYVAVTNYEVMPDEMNEGSEIRTAYITAVFPGAPEGHNVVATVFPSSGEAVAIDEMAWLVEREFGQQLIAEYDNYTTAVRDGENICYDIILSYMVPSDYDEVSFAITDGSYGKGYDVLKKSDVVYSDTLWFVMGSYANGMLSYNGNTVATAPATADISLLGISGASGNSWSDNTMEDVYYEEVYEEDTSSAGYRTLQLIPFGAVTEGNSDGRSLSFAAIELVECYADANIINVTINYSGHKSGDTISILMYDAYNELHLDEQEKAVSGNGSVTFTFSCPASTAPYTFSAITEFNGQFIQNNIHVDADVF